MSKEENNSYLFIPHSPLQFQVYGMWAAQLQKDKYAQTILLLISEPLKDWIADLSVYDKVVSLESESNNLKKLTVKEAFKVIEIAENRYKDCCFAKDWSIDRAYQNIGISYHEALIETANHIRVIEQLFATYEIIGACSEKLFIPQRMVHRILSSNGKRHVVPIGDRFFQRFYFETGLDSWPWDDFHKVYNEIPNEFEPSPEVIEAHKAITQKGFKRILLQQKKKSGQRLEKGQVNTLRRTKLKATTKNNIYGRYLSGFGKTFGDKVKTRLQKIKNLEYYNRLVSHKIPQGKSIVFLMHMQPEYTVDGIATDYFNQVELCGAIAKSLPVGVPLLVKENPRTIGTVNRPQGYYREFVRHPNIIFLHHSVDAHTLIKSSEAVITLTGTVGIEAMLFGKTCFVAGNIFYRTLPGFKPVSSRGDLITKLNSFLRQDLQETERSPKETRELGLRFLESHYRATLPGQMYNGYHPYYHTSPQNLERLNKGFLCEFQRAKSMNNFKYP